MILRDNERYGKYLCEIENLGKCVFEISICGFGELFTLYCNKEEIWSCDTSEENDEIDDLEDDNSFYLGFIGYPYYLSEIKLNKSDMIKLDSNISDEEMYELTISEHNYVPEKCDYYKEVRKPMDFFISDLHIGDANILTYEHRPFKNLKDMEETIIKNWNNVVTDKDTVYLMGDIGDISVLKKLKGNIIIVLGNHDNADMIVKEYPNMEINKHPIMVGPLWLSHEPIGYMPPEIPYLNIHGHLHRFDYGLPDRTWAGGNRYFNVSVEKIGYTPISRDEITKIIKY